MSSGTHPHVYHTPFVLRTGFLYSYGRTFPFVALWAVATNAILAASGVIMNVVFDTWTYLFVPYILGVVHIARSALKGYDDLFGILDRDEDADFDRNLALHRDMQWMRTREERSMNQEQIFHVFDSEGPYLEYKQSVRRMVFSKYERYLTLALVLCAPAAIVVYYVMYSQAGLYGVFIAPWWQLYVVVNFVFGWIFLMGLVSMLWIVVTMILSISHLEGYRDHMKIAEYLRLLKGDRIDRVDQVMGYDTFYASTTPIGSFLYGLTWKAMVMIVIYAVNLILFSFLRSLNLGVGLYIMGIGIVLVTALFFLWPQLGLHGVLSRRKREILNALIVKRDDLHAEIMILSATSSREGATDLVRNTVEVKEKDLSQVQSIIDNMSGRTTWGFETRTMLRLVGGSATPLMISAARDIAIMLGLLPPS